LISCCILFFSFLPVFTTPSTTVPTTTVPITTFPTTTTPDVCEEILAIDYNILDDPTRNSEHGYEPFCDDFDRDNGIPANHTSPDWRGQGLRTYELEDCYRDFDYPVNIYPAMFYYLFFDSAN
jgi:hypothetical protein